MRIQNQFITVETLKRKCACEEGIEWFEESFPNGEWLRAVMLRIYKDSGDSIIYPCIGWLCWNASEFGDSHIPFDLCVGNTCNMDCASNWYRQIVWYTEEQPH